MCIYRNETLIMSACILGDACL